MTTPRPAAPPYRASLIMQSKTMATGFRKDFYLKTADSYVSAIAEATTVLNALLPLLPSDCMCLGIHAENDDPAVKGDGYVKYFKHAEKSGSYSPTEGTDGTTEPYEVALKQRLQDTVDGIHSTEHIRPVPHTLCAGGKLLTADDAYTAALTTYNGALIAHTMQSVKSPGGTALTKNVNEVITDYELTDKDVGRPFFQTAGRRKSQTII